MNDFDEKIASIDWEYPIKGTFLQKCKFIKSRKIPISDKEEKELIHRAMTEGSNGLKRYIQIIFSLYPYEGN